eukprot:12089209-Alexandrium_andersonii.AAC.1
MHSFTCKNERADYRIADSRALSVVSADGVSQTASSQGGAQHSRHPTPWCPQAELERRGVAGR